MSKILAIDLGKFKSVTCLLETETNETRISALKIKPRLLATCRCPRLIRVPSR